MPEHTLNQSPSKPWIIKKLVSASWVKLPWPPCDPEAFPFCGIYYLHLTSLSMLTLSLDDLNIQDRLHNLVKSHNHNLSGSIDSCQLSKLSAFCVWLLSHLNTSEFTDCLPMLQTCFDIIKMFMRTHSILSLDNSNLNVAYKWQSRQRHVECWPVYTCQCFVSSNCSESFKQQKHCCRLVCAVGKTSLQQLSGTRRCIHDLLTHSDVHCAPFSQSHGT